MKHLLWSLFIVASLIIAIFLIFPNLESVFIDWLEAVKTNAWLYSLVSFTVLSLDVFLPIPSSIVMYSNGLILGLILGFFLSFVSSLTSSCLGYMLAYFLPTWKQTKKDEMAENNLRAYGSMAIIISRGIPIISETISICAGLQKFSFRLFFLANLLGYLPVCFTYAYFGSISSSAEYFLISFGSTILFALGFWLVGKKLSHKPI